MTEWLAHAIYDNLKGRIFVGWIALQAGSGIMGVLIGMAFALRAFAALD